MKTISSPNKLSQTSMLNTRS